VDILFTPSAADMYQDNSRVSVSVDGLSDILEGSVRPGHFCGVATVVAKLFHITKPHKAFFGQKDFQQGVIIRRMVQGLNMDVTVVVLPTVREKDGLAMSSRNKYLNEGDRRVAPVLYRALSAGRTLITSGERNAATVKEEMKALIRKEKGARIDYVEIADPDTLAPLATVGKTAVLLAAVRIGSTRLIDNLTIP
jgi:pantoate--beta-alanine ligase